MTSMVNSRGHNMILVELTDIIPDCANDPRNVCAVRIPTFVGVIIVVRDRRAARTFLNPSSDIGRGQVRQVRMTTIVSCINDADFYIRFGGYGPERADVYAFDAPRYDFCLRLDATVRK